MGLLHRHLVVHHLGKQAARNLAVVTHWAMAWEGGSGWHAVPPLASQVPRTAGKLRLHSTHHFTSGSFFLLEIRSGRLQTRGPCPYPCLPKQPRDTAGTCCPTLQYLRKFFALPSLAVFPVIFLNYLISCYFMISHIFLYLYTLQIYNMKYN